MRYNTKLKRQFIVIDLQEGKSWRSDDWKEVLESIGYGEMEDKSYDEVKKKIEGVYEIIGIYSASDIELDWIFE
jgi:hypothetical protein